jgi:hypothetical protein
MNACFLYILALRKCKKCEQRAFESKYPLPLRWSSFRAATEEGRDVRGCVRQNLATSTTTSAAGVLTQAAVI